MSSKEENSDFTYLGKRIDKALKYVKTNKPDLIEWFKEYIEDPYLNMIYGELELEEEDYTFDYLDSLLDDIEEKFNVTFETKQNMNQENLRLQMLSGIITEGEYKAKLEENTTKESLNENFVGMEMVGNIFDRERSDYELAFEHFTKGKIMNEGDDGLEDLIDWAQTKLWGDYDYDESEVEKMSPQKLYSELENLIYKNDPDYPKFKEFESMVNEEIEEETMKEGVSKDDEKLYLAFIKAANFLKGGGSDTEAWEMMWDEYPYM